MSDNITQEFQKYKAVKKRYWLAVFYPESLPKNWLDILKATGVEFAISPLHDKDKAEDGNDSLKKAHYHIIFSYPAPTTFANIKSITDSLSQPFPKPCENIKRAYEYLWHKNDADKFQYEKKDIQVFNGFNIANVTELEKAEVMQIKKDLQTLIREKNIIEYADFLDLILDEYPNEWYEIATSNTIMFRAYLSSRRHKIINRC